MGGAEDVAGDSDTGGFGAAADGAGLGGKKYEWLALVGIVSYTVLIGAAIAAIDPVLHYG